MLPVADGEGRAALVEGTVKEQTSPVRWWLLFLVTLIAGYQGNIWNNFGPIAQAVKPFYGWDNSNIAMLGSPYAPVNKR